MCLGPAVNADLPALGLERSLLQLEPSAQESPLGCYTGLVST